MKEIINIFDLVDIWKNKYSNLNGFTWCRIDFIFVSSDIIDDINNVKVRRIPVTQQNGGRLSDHRYIQCKSKMCKLQRGPGFWKLNVSHLENDYHKTGITKIIENLDG